MFTYTFSGLAKLGDFDPKYGQSYWGTPNEHLKPVKFNSMNRGISLGDKITAEERTEKKSAKGIEYYQLKKVKVVEGPTTTEKPAERSVQGSQSQLDRIEAKLDKLLGNDVELSHAESQAKRDAKTINEPLPDEPPDYGDEEGY